MNLLIIESPNKIETIKKFLGKEWEVFATGGHIRDLPEKSIGLDFKNNFEPKYELRADKANTIKKLKDKAKNAKKIFIATDPDREGEAIGWHVATILGLNLQDKNRVEFNSITKEVVQSSIENPRTLDKNMIDAQQARRVLDRLVGYKISPIICKRIAARLSAGRVQSVALKLVVDRENEIQNFVPEEYWTLTAELEKPNQKPTFKATLNTITNKKIKLHNKNMMDRVLAHIENGKYIVTSTKKSVSKSHPQPPFTTSTMQQDAINKLGMSLKQVTACAQELYEGVQLGKLGKTALVTYIRTDSVRVSDEARVQAKKYIIEKYGEKYYPTKPNFYKSKGDNVQDAHEAIRPAHFELTPESVKPYLSPTNYKLYKLIFERFFASQMSDATYDSVSAVIENNDCQFKVTGKTPKFAGYTVIYSDIKKQKDEDDEQENSKLPELLQGDILNLIKLTPEQKFTKPQPRYTEATLVHAMEENGIGRPATYTPTITNIMSRGYIEKQSKALVPTKLGQDVNELVQKYFSTVINVNFTAKMEDKLDEIATDGIDWHNMINSFYDKFSVSLQKANGDKIFLSDRPKPEVSDVLCDKCGSKMVIKSGKFGKFLACPNYPKCKNIKSLDKPAGKCPVCGKNLFQYSTKKGKLYYACEDKTKCKFISWDLPLTEKCPKCDSYLLQKKAKVNMTTYCSNTNCDYKRIERIKEVENADQDTEGTNEN